MPTMAMRMVMGMTKDEKTQMASAIIEAMREQYELEGIEGDFDDGYRYLTHDASDAEVRDEYEKWVNKD